MQCPVGWVNTTSGIYSKSWFLSYYKFTRNCHKYSNYRSKQIQVYPVSHNALHTCKMLMQMWNNSKGQQWGVWYKITQYWRHIMNSINQKKSKIVKVHQKHNTKNNGWQLQCQYVLSKNKFAARLRTWIWIRGVNISVWKQNMRSMNEEETKYFVKHQNIHCTFTSIYSTHHTRLHIVQNTSTVAVHWEKVHSMNVVIILKTLFTGYR